MAVDDARHPVDLLSLPGEQRPQAAPRAVESGADLNVLRSAAAGCRGCDLWSRATQTVFGAGPVPARIMLVGEQPGDQEDIAGAPFVGPAGRMLDRALLDAGIDREKRFVTNVVKHFKWRAFSGRQTSPSRTSVASRGRCLSAMGRIGVGARSTGSPGRDGRHGSGRSPRSVHPGHARPGPADPIGS